MKIIALDSYTLNPGDNPWDEIAALGELVLYDRTPEEKILERSRGAEILVTNKAPVSAETIRQLDGLKGICVTATGYNIVDIRAARERGIPVSNVPVYGTNSVAQFVFALLLTLGRRIELHDRRIREGAWQASQDFSFWDTPQIEFANK